MDMLEHGHDAFQLPRGDAVPRHQRRPPKPRHMQLSLGEQLSDQILSTPVSYSNSVHTHFDAFPLPEPGPFSCVSPSDLHIPIHGHGHRNYWPPSDHLDILENLEQVDRVTQHSVTRLANHTSHPLDTPVSIKNPRRSYRKHQRPYTQLPAIETNPVPMLDSPSTATQPPEALPDMLRKRSREHHPPSPKYATDLPEIPVKIPRLHESQVFHRRHFPGHHPGISDLIEPAKEIHEETEQYSAWSRQGNAGTIKLSNKQKKFIRRWLEDFTEGHTRLMSEDINALATLVKAPSQPVLDYVNTKLPIVPVNQTHVSDQRHVHLSANLPHVELSPASSSGYSLVEANKHLLPATLQLVEKYVKASQRRRASSDGRRRVNRGPFRCTFGCGYATKRAFDWRRHEETHEPQELWLCHFCCQNRVDNPFLVNRRDKFLKHAKDTHKERDPEEVLDMSKVEFIAKFDPKCPICPQVHETWDDRCKCVLAHYEDEIAHKSKRGTGFSDSGDRIDSTSEQDTSDILDNFNSGESMKE